MTASTSMTPISALFDEVMVQVPGATGRVIELATKATLREFFVKSGAWVKETHPVSVIAYEDTYYLDPQPDGQILYIHAIAYPTGDRFKYLTPVTEQTFRSRVNAPSAIPLAWRGYTDFPGKFTLTPVVTEDLKQALYPYIAMTLPDDDHCGTTGDQIFEVPSWMLRYWSDDWIEGIVGRLMIQPEKTYTNPAQARYYQRRFNNAMAVARDMARRQFTSADTQFEFPRWA